MPEKIRYEIVISTLLPPPTTASSNVRPISREDLDALARLMLDAYVGTIDYDDESLEDAVEEVRSFLEDASAMFNCSYAVEHDGELVSAILVSLSDGSPFIGYVMTTPAHKNRGLARLVTKTALEQLRRDGHERAVLYITEGNTASEALFASVGAIRV